MPRPMADLRTVTPLLKRGALLAAANWEVIVLQFLAESAFKLLLVVPGTGRCRPSGSAGRRECGGRRHA